MLFTLKKLGRLEEATIDLGKDLIVLTGPNNTSKTYVAHAIYGFCAVSLPEGMEGMFSPVGDRLVSLSGSERVEVDLVKLLREHFDLVLNKLGEACTARLGTFFASSPQFTAHATVIISVSEGGLKAAESGLLEKEDGGLHGAFFYEVPKGSGVLIATRQVQPIGKDDPGVEYMHAWVSGYAASALEVALFGGIRRVHILTAERSAVEIFSHELAAQRFDPLVRDVPPPAYPLALAHGLKAAQQLAWIRNATSPYSAEADRLEREILDGKVEIGAHGEMAFIPIGTTEPLDMNVSSSSVKALAWLCVYLRHLASEGGFLIIDEPELNLHPHNQRLVARLLARLSRSGIKVMISTHSDYIVRELNNLIMLSRDKGGKLREKHGYGEDEILDPERVGAYAFDGAHGSPIAIGPAGIKVEAFDRDIKDLNRSASDIYFALDEQGDEA